METFLINLKPSFNLQQFMSTYSIVNLYKFLTKILKLSTSNKNKKSPDARVKEFMRWNEDTYSPDEHIWASLQRWYPVLPGSYPPHPKYDRNELVSIPRLVKWAGLDDGDSPAYPKCEGKYMRGELINGFLL